MEKVIQFDWLRYKQEENTYRYGIHRAKPLVEAYNSIKALPDITDETFESFIIDPQGYYENQVLKLKKARFGDDPIDLDQFKKLYKLDFPKLPKPEKGEVLEMVNGEIDVKASALNELKEWFTYTTSDPKLIELLEAIEELVSQYDKVFALCYGNNSHAEKHDFSEFGYDRENKQFDVDKINGFVN